MNKIINMLNKNNSKFKIYNSKLLMSVLAGVLLALSYPPFPFFFLAFVGLVPLLYIFEVMEVKSPTPLLQRWKREKRFRYVYLTFSIYHAISNWWIGSWQRDTDPFLTFGGIAVWLVHPLLFFIPFLIYFPIRRKFGVTALWLFPFIWTGFEWFHSLGDLAYPWLNLGYTQIYNYWCVQIADIIGVLGLGFFIAFMNVLILKIVLISKRTGVKDSIFGKDGIFSIAFMNRYMIAILLVIIVPFIYGIFRTGEFVHMKLISEKKSLKVGIIQPNINPWQKWQGSVYNQILTHQRIQDSLRNAAGKFDLGIWSETAIPFLDEELNARHNFSFIQRWVDTSGISLLTGFSDIYIYKEHESKPITARPYFFDTTKYFDAYNSAVILNPEVSSQKSEDRIFKNIDENGNIYKRINSVDERNIYHKMRLTPLGESVPFVELFSFTRKWLEWGVGISGWRKGDEQHNLEFIRALAGSQSLNKKDSVIFGTIICIESIFPDFVKTFVQQGAEFLVIITNDAWYNYTPGPEQHYLIASMRAIETRRYIVRCANSGVSGIISPTGESIKKVAPYETLGFTGQIPLVEEKTIYVQYGDIFAIASAIISIIALLYSLLYKSKNKI